MTWNPELQQLVYSPLQEQDELRGTTLAASTAPQALSGFMDIVTGAAAGSRGNQSEVEVVFQIPTKPTRMGVQVLGNVHTSRTSSTQGWLFYVDFEPATSATTTAEGVYTAVAGATNTPSDMSSGENHNDTLRLSPNDKTISIRVYVDNTLCEAYWQNGRVAMTVRTQATPEASVSIYSSNETIVQSYEVHAVKPIWVSPSDVIAAPRKDGRPTTGREGAH